MINERDCFSKKYKTLIECKSCRVRSSCGRTQRAALRIKRNNTEKKRLEILKERKRIGAIF